MCEDGTDWVLGVMLLVNNKFSIFKSYFVISDFE